ncbi:hypothetical protein BDW66DRAFT_143108 [Aspergillus desertorum]
MRLSTQIRLATGNMVYGHSSSSCESLVKDTVSSDNTRLVSRSDIFNRRSSFSSAMGC